METIICGRWNKHSSDYDETKNLWRLRNLHDAGRASDEDLLAAQDAVTKLLMGQLDKAGVSILGDGCIRWDSIFDISRKIHGCRGFEELVRIPRTNHFHRQPVATLPLFFERPALAYDLERATENTAKPILVCLPGPYSLAKQTKNVSRTDLRTLAEAYANALRVEAWHLTQSPRTIVRVDEPLMPHDERGFAVFASAIYHLVEGADSSKLMLYPGFGKIMSPARYFSLPFGIFFVDFTKNSPEILKCLDGNKKLAAGIVEGRQTYNDPIALTKNILRGIFTYVPPERVFLTTSSDLHFLPGDKSLDKVKRVVSIASIPKEEIMALKVGGRRNFDFQFRSGTKSKSIRPEPIAPSSLQTIPFPTSTVGSFPQSRELRQMRADLRNGKIGEDEYQAAADARTKDWMDFQEEIGITFPVGGEFLREDMAAYFGIRFGGKLLDFVPSYENRRYRPVEYKHRILPLGQSLLLPDFRFVQSLTEKPVKETITGPATLADWALIKNRLYYYNRNAFRTDLAIALRAEIEKLIDGGAKIIQVDEPALTTNMENFESDWAAIHEMVKGLGDHAYLILHICYSNMEDLNEAFPRILQLPFHQIHMEMANRKYDLLRLIERHGFGGKDIGLGVVDVHTDRVETVDEIVEGVRRVKTHFRKNEGVWITPDCGLKERSDQVAKAKLRVMAEAAEVCRNMF